MKKTWKERLYDVSRSQFVVRYIPGLLFGLALLSIVCCFVFGILFYCLYGQCCNEKVVEEFKGIKTVTEIKEK